MTSSSEGVDGVGVVLTIGLICVLAVVANVLVVVVVTTRKEERQPGAAAFFMINLAVSDLILAGITMPLILLDANIPQFTKNNSECKLKMALPLFNICSSVYTMVLMSFDRLRVIVQGQPMSRKQAAISILVTWILSLLLTAPQFYEYRLVEKLEEAENETEIACSSAGRDPLFLQTYAVLVLIVAYLLPLLVLTRNYLHVLLYVVQRAAQVQGQVSRAKIRVLWTIVTITVVFVLLWLPFFVLFTIEEVTGTDDSSHFSTAPHVIKQVFVALSALSNPVIYFSLLPDYRRALHSLLMPADCCANTVYPEQVFDTDTHHAALDVSDQQPGTASVSPAARPRAWRGQRAKPGRSATES